MSASIDLSILIVSYNTRGLLRDCLASLAAERADLVLETIVVDNASSDGSAEMVRESFPEVRLLVNDRNAGFAAANNIGLRLARGRHLLLLNSDTRVRRGALAALVHFMAGRPAAGYCGPKLFNADGSHQPSARRFHTPLSAGFALLALRRRWPGSVHNIDLHSAHGNSAPFRADWLTGACLMVRAEAFRQVGLLDEGYFMYFEEADWCRRLAAQGWEGWFVPTAHVVHLGGGSVRLESAVRPFAGDHPVYWVRSGRRYMRRHYGVAAAVLSELIQVVLYALVWLRHCWRRTTQSRSKATSAASAIRHFLDSVQLRGLIGRNKRC